MSKSARIEALERDLDQLTRAVDRLAAQVKELRNPPEVPAGRSLGAVVRDEIRDRRDSLLEALGL